MGLTFKENVADTRESPVKEIIKDLKEYAIEVLGYNPLINDIEDEFGVKSIQSLDDASEIDCIILTVAHDIFKEITLDKLKTIMNKDPILIDVRGFFDREKALKKGFLYRML